MRLAELAEPRVVQRDHRVDRLRGDGVRVVPERLVQLPVSPRASVGGLATANRLGTLGEAGGHLGIEFEEGVEVERRGVAVAGHGGEEAGDVERRLGPDPVGGLRDRTRQPRVRSARVGPVADPRGLSWPSTAIVQSRASDTPKTPGWIRFVIRGPEAGRCIGESSRGPGSCRTSSRIGPRQISL